MKQFRACDLAGSLSSGRVRAVHVRIRRGDMDSDGDAVAEASETDEEYVYEEEDDGTDDVVLADALDADVAGLVLIADDIGSRGFRFRRPTAPPRIVPSPSHNS